MYVQSHEKNKNLQTTDATFVNQQAAVGELLNNAQKNKNNGSVVVIF